MVESVHAPHSLQTRSATLFWSSSRWQKLWLGLVGAYPVHFPYPAFHVVRSPTQAGSVLPGGAGAGVGTGVRVGAAV